MAPETGRGWEGRKGGPSKMEIKIGSGNTVGPRGSHSKLKTGRKTAFLIKKPTLHNRSSSHSLSSRVVSGQKIRTGESLKTQNLEN